METKNITVTTTSEQLNALKAFLKALKIKFEISTSNEETPLWHKEIITKRLDNLNEDELVSWNELKKDLDNKYGA